MGYMLEDYEWDRTWIEKANDKTAKRVLYIGDSISCGTRTSGNKLSGGEMLFDGYGTSKALDNPYYFESLLAFAKQEPKRDAVVFNNGLHGWHLSEEEYERLYKDFVDKLLNEFTDVPLMIVLTTFPINKDYCPDRVVIRNEIARKIAAERGLEVIDLYTVSQENKNSLCDDGVHFVEEGYDVLAKAVMESLKNRI